MDDEQIDLKEQQFNDVIRNIVVFMCIYFLLAIIAYLIIKLLRKKSKNNYDINYEDAIADMISTGLCIFTLTTCLCSVLLLPMSILANELIHIYSNSFYWKWLNTNLIYGLWNKTFLFSNLSLFICLPFAYFLHEAIGLPGYQKGIKARIIETCLLLLIITLSILGITYVVSSVIDTKNAQEHSLLNIQDYHLPFLYSCISFIGVLLLLLCAPFGFETMFSFIFKFNVKTSNIVELKDKLYSLKFEKNYLNMKKDSIDSNGSEDDKLKLIEVEIQKIETQITRSNIFKNVGYPLSILILLFLTFGSAIIVILNTIYLLFGVVSITQNSFDIGIKSLYRFGMWQTVLEIILIIYFIIASLIGFYNLPLFRKIRPSLHNTGMRRIILNCLIILLFSSALPIVSKILGLTNFDLLGSFGQLDWLSNLNLILFYNIGFEIAVVSCLLNKFTSRVRSELYNKCLFLIKTSIKSLNRSCSLTS